MLPWAGAGRLFNCATVKSGSSCVLTLTYAPTADASGTLTIAYSYMNSDGVVQVGLDRDSLRFDGGDDTVSATAAPTGQIRRTLSAHARP